MPQSGREITELLERLNRAGYTIGQEQTDDDGILRLEVNGQRMTLPELNALASQDTEQQEKL